MSEVQNHFTLSFIIGTQAINPNHTITLTACHNIHSTKCFFNVPCQPRYSFIKELLIQSGVACSSLSPDGKAEKGIKCQIRNRSGNRNGCTRSPVQMHFRLLSKLQYIAIAHFWLDHQPPPNTPITPRTPPQSSNMQNEATNVWLLPAVDPWEHWKREEKISSEHWMVGQGLTQKLIADDPDLINLKLLAIYREPKPKYLNRMCSTSLERLIWTRF